MLHVLNTKLVDPYIVGIPTNVTESWSANMVPGVNRAARWLGGAELTPSPFGHPYAPQYHWSRHFIVLSLTLYLGSLFLYFIPAACTYYTYFKEDRELARRRGDVDNSRANRAWWRHDGKQIKAEMWTSVWSLFVMAGMVAPLELIMMNGYGQVYHNIDDYGWGYFLLSPFLFLAFTDCLIYYIHRILHWGPIYKVHKLHHRFKETTPFSAFSFHPLDGWLQGLPYHIFVLLFPMHNIMYTFTLLVVGLWTINIHDRVTFGWFGVNGAAHHTIHHTKFNYNYGQYFTFWDRLCGTWADPYKHAPYNRPPYMPLSAAVATPALQEDPNDLNYTHDPNDGPAPVHNHKKEA